MRTLLMASLTVFLLLFNAAADESCLDCGDEYNLLPIEVLLFVKGECGTLQRCQEVLPECSPAGVCYECRSLKECPNCEAVQGCVEETMLCAIGTLRYLLEGGSILHEDFVSYVKRIELKIAYGKGFGAGWQAGWKTHALCAESPDCDDYDKDDGCGKNHCLDQGNGKKVTICHIPPGNPGNSHSIRVGRAAVSAHLRHGDELGPCENGKLYRNLKKKLKGLRKSRKKRKGKGKKKDK